MEQKKKPIPSGNRKKRKAARKEQTPNFSVHLIFLILIVAVLLFAIIKFLLWNKGEASDYNPDEITTEFDVETMDYIQPMDSSRFEGITDDGVTTLLCLGNSPFADNKGEGGLADALAKKMNGVAYDGSFANSYQAAVNYPYQDSYPLDAFSLYHVVEAICTGDYSKLDTAAALTGETETQTVNMLKSLDYNTVDMLVIMYDLNDYLAGRALYNPLVKEDTATWTGSLSASLELLETTYPHIRTVILSTPACGATVNGTYIDGDITDLGSGTLPTYLNYQIAIAMEYGVSYIDTYYGVINSDTKEEYLVNDYHLSEKGIQALADRFYYFFGEL